MCMIEMFCLATMIIMLQYINVLHECNIYLQFSLSVMSNSLQPHELQHARPPCPSPTPGVYSNSSIESVTPSSHLILCRPLLLLPLIPPSIQVFSNESTLCMQWPKYWSFSLSISPSIYTLNAHKVICQLYLKNERNHPSTSPFSLIPEIFPSLNPACYSSIFQEISLALAFPPDACNFIVLLDKLLQRVIYTHCLKLTFL